MEYRTQDGSIKSQGQIRALNKNVSIPKVWNADVCASLNIDPVLEAPKPEASGAYKRVLRNGAVQDASDNWVQAWVEQDMFADTTDEDGKKTTKKQHETAYQATLDTKTAVNVRKTRNALLADSDWTQITDATVDKTTWATYRQSLRDITKHSNFPNLDSDDWPVAP